MLGERWQWIFLEGCDYNLFFKATCDLCQRWLEMSAHCDVDIDNKYFNADMSLMFYPALLALLAKCVHCVYPCQNVDKLILNEC